MWVSWRKRCRAGQHVNWPRSPLCLQRPDWLADHPMEPRSNQDTRLHRPAPEAQTHDTLPPHGDDAHFSYPATPPPTYSEAGANKTMRECDSDPHDILMKEHFRMAPQKDSSVLLTLERMKSLTNFSCQCSPARSLPGPDTPQRATRSLCGGASPSHARSDCADTQWRNARCLRHDSSTLLRRCRLESSLLTLSWAPNQVKGSSWHRSNEPQAS